MGLVTYFSPHLSGEMRSTVASTAKLRIAPTLPASGAGFLPPPINALTLLGLKVGPPRHMVMEPLVS